MPEISTMPAADEPTAAQPEEAESSLAGDTETTPEPPSIQAPPAPTLRKLMARYTGPRDLDGQLRLSAQLAQARYAIPRRYRDSAPDILAMMHHAIALDIDLMIALDNLHFNPEGQGGMRARLMHALALRAGHAIEPLHQDTRLVRLRIVRGDDKPGGTASWSILEAQTAGLIRPDTGWRAYPGDLLWARCMSRLLRRFAPEVLLGFYEVSELDDISYGDELPDPVDLTALTDIDGNETPAPDVVELLKDLDRLTFQEIRLRWQQAREEGVLRAYAGTVDGTRLTVEEVIINAGNGAEVKERRELKKQQRKSQAAAAVIPQDLSDADKPTRPAPAEQQRAGQGGQLACGCDAAELTSTGQHQEGCTDGV